MTSDGDRAERLARQLRENLRRRKAQARGASVAEPSGQADQLAKAEEPSASSAPHAE